MLELWGIQGMPLLALLPGPLQPGAVALDRVLSMDQIELFDIKTMSGQMAYIRLNG